MKWQCSVADQLQLNVRASTFSLVTRSGLNKFRDASPVEYESSPWVEYTRTPRMNEFQVSPELFLGFEKLPGRSRYRCCTPRHIAFQQPFRFKKLL